MQMKVKSIPFPDSIPRNATYSYTYTCTYKLAQFLTHSSIHPFPPPP